MPKVYDCFPYDGEGVLDLRLRLLWDAVDWFVIGEAELTHVGKPKAIRFDERRYAWAMPKIRFLRIGPQVFERCANDWERENLQRIELKRGFADAADDDIVMVSDADEIPNPALIAGAANHPRDGIRAFEQLMFYFYGDYLCVSDPFWVGTKAVSGATARASSLQDIRTDPKRLGRRVTKVPDGGWHFSYLGGVETVLEKVERFVHTEMNVPEYKNREQMRQRIARGEDIFFRPLAYARVAGYERTHRAVKDWFEARRDLLSPQDAPFAGDIERVVARHRGLGRFWRKLRRSFRKRVGPRRARR